MTTQPGWEPRPGPTRGETARRAPRGAAGGWPDDPARRRASGAAAVGGAADGGGPVGRGRGGYDPRARGGRGVPAGGRGQGPLPGPPAPGGPGQGNGRGPRNRPGWSGRDDRGGRPRPPAEPRERPGSGASGGSRSPLRWIGALSTRNAMLALVAATLIGIVATLIAGSEPGFLLSFFIIVGAVVATLGVRPGAVYLFFPLPAFAFFVGAVITGKVHDSSFTSSTAGLGAGFLQWIAFIFFPMCVATIVVLVIGGARWLLSRQLVSGQFPMSADRPATARSPRPRSDIDPWADPKAPRTRSDLRPGTAPRLDPDGTRPARTVRDDRDPWNDPRPSADPRTAADRRPTARPPTPPAGPQPGFRPRPGGSGQPGQADRAQRPPAPPRPGRPGRDPWDQR